MSGHSKWSKIKHQKATTDVVKGQAFTKVSRALTIAVKEGGGISDPNLNFRLRLAVEKAREVNMPKNTIVRAVERGKGGGAETIEQVLYEGYGPGGVAILIEAATDNRQRTVAEIKHVFDRFGGSLATPGAVNYLFTRSGVITVVKAKYSFDTIMEVALDAGAEDIVDAGDVFEIYVTPQTFIEAIQTLEGKGITLDNTELIMRPVTVVKITDAVQNQLDKLIQELTALEDVQKVYENAS